MSGNPIKSLENHLLLRLAAFRRSQLLDSDPFSRQEYVLRRLLKLSEHTEFGRSHGFSSIRSSRQFLSSVPPMSYDDLRPQIDRILEGRRNVLFPGVPKCFGVTTGSEGKAKLIPLNSTLLRSTRMAAIDAALLGSVQRCSLSWHRAKTLYIGPRKGRLLDSWNVFSEGTAFVYLQAGSLRARFVPGYDDLPGPQENNDSDFLKACIDRYPIRSVAGNPLEIVGFADSTQTVMPDVEIVMNCGYWAADHQHVYERAFPNATVVDIYGSNEGIWGLPVSSGKFLLNHPRVFFSFLPLDGGHTAVGLENTQIGRKYKLCVTTPSGLWNYLTGDVVCFENVRPPLFMLCGRYSRALPLEEGWLTENEVVGAVRKSAWYGLDYYLSLEANGCILYFDGAEPDAETVDRNLCQMNAAYRHLRASGKLAALAVRRMRIVRRDRAKPVRIKVQSEPKGACHEAHFLPDQSKHLP